MAVKISIDNITENVKIVLFHRKKSGLSRIDLADIAGVGKTALYDTEHGKETVRRLTLLKVMAVLNIHIRLESPFMELYK